MDAQADVLHAGLRDHIALFYTEDSELTGKVGGYLLAALRHGGVAIVVATPEHRLVLARNLIRAGIDLTAAEADGTYRELDVGEIIDAVVVGSSADAGSFWAALAPVLRRASTVGQPVRVFGEVVALLWRAGLVGAAIDVEAMWNELAGQFPFSLVCGYPINLVSHPVHYDSLTEICRAHSVVAGEPPASMRGWRY